MPPADRQNFRRNAERWMQMSPAERNVLRQRENLRRQTIQRETESALRESGLRLSPQERAQFESRYIQERRKVEQSLRQQIELERQKELPALIQQLKKEFQLTSRPKVPPQNHRSRLIQKDRVRVLFFCIPRETFVPKKLLARIAPSQLALGFR